MDTNIATSNPSRIGHDADLSVAAIIPLYNGARWIEQSIASVLAQTLPPDEFIVVDDGSTDNGPAIVEQLATKYPITLLRQTNQGQSAARNNAIAHANSAFIALLDQDDIWYPTHLQDLIEPFRDQKNVGLGWVYSDFDEVDVDGLMMTRCFMGKLAEHPKRNLIRCLSEDMLITPGAALIRRSAFEAVGGFDPLLSGYEDDDLFLRMFRCGYENIFLEHALSQWRIFDGSAGHTHRMYVSAMIYMDKLLATYPDDLFRGHYYRRDLIAPRFVRTMYMIYGRALRQKDAARCREAVTHLKKIYPHLGWKRKLELALALPLLARPTTGRLFFAARPVLAKAARIVFAVLR